MRIKQALQWTLGFSDQIHIAPDTYIPAAVPGAVQLDMKRAHNLPDYNFGCNVRQYEWMEKKYWHYKAAAHVEQASNQIPFLVFESIEYRYDIYINSHHMTSGEGIYTPVTLNLSEFLGQNITVEVIIHPAPIRPGAAYRKKEYSASCKAPFSYGWDWSPRMVALGICGNAYLEYRPLSAIEQFDITYTLSSDLSSANVEVTFSTLQPADSITFALYGQQKEPVFETALSIPENHGALSFTLNDPALWWPSGHGSQNMYTAVLQAFVASGMTDRAEKRTGFRSVKLVMNEGEWERSEALPATQRKCPAALEINGKRIFAKGSNWVPPDFFLSRMTDELYDTLIRLVKDAHMNILRIWGGGYVNRDIFFDLCDQYGILVWQEFPLACANYPDDDEYLTVLDQESVSVIRRLRSHPCLSIWCGGNELFNEWSGMTNQSLALRLLGRNCFDLDRHTPFMAASPLYGMGHGHYIMYDGTQEALQIFQNAAYTAYTEFGCAAPSPYFYIESCIPSDECTVLTNGGSYELHHAVSAWRSENDWFSRNIIEYFCGETNSVKEAAEKGVFVQSLMYPYMFEAARMQQPYCSMALNWCFNEPWPTAAGNSLINYPALPKPAYFTVKNALRGKKASVRPDKLLWWFEEDCIMKIWILNDTPDEIPAGSITAFLESDGNRKELLTWNHPVVPAMNNLEGPALSFQVPSSSDRQFVIELNASQPELSDRYTLLCRQQNS